MNELYDDLKNRFLNYIIPFKTTGDANSPIRLKEEHTFRVCDDILNIAEKLGLEANDRLIAYSTAILHDIGRFEQYKRYQTFVDYMSTDHAALGIQIIAENQFLNGFDQNDADLIIKAVQYHNRINIPDGETERVCFFAKLIRDADKLDILNVFQAYYSDPENYAYKDTIELDLPNTNGFSQKVYDALIEGRVADTKNVRNITDFLLLRLGWVFDINFHPTFNAILERGYIKSMESMLGDTETFQPLFQRIYAYIAKQLDKGSEKNNWN